MNRRTWLVLAFMLAAAARDALGDPRAGRAVERALDLAEPDRALAAFLIHPAPGLLERHARDCANLRCVRAGRRFCGQRPVVPGFKSFY